MEPAAASRLWFDGKRASAVVLTCVRTRAVKEISAPVKLIRGRGQRRPSRYEQTLMDQLLGVMP
jgi:hypothetical protein